MCTEITSVLQFILWFLCLKHYSEGELIPGGTASQGTVTSLYEKDLEEERNETVEGQREIEALTTGLARAELALEDARDPEPR